MISDHISKIKDWPTLDSNWDIRALHGFVNCYRRFTRKYAMVTTPISAVQNMAETSRTPKQLKSEWTGDSKLAFRKLNSAFTRAPILNHFDTAKPIILRNDASNFGIASILNQYDGLGILRLVNFYCEIYSGPTQNLNTSDRELMAISESMKQWRHYLEGANYKVLIQCDHKTLEDFQTSNVLSMWQASWTEMLSSYDSVIEHLEGKKNPVDGPSRRRDYEIGFENTTARLLASLAATTISESYGDLLLEFKAAQETGFVARTIRPTLVDVSIPEESQWRPINWAITYQRRIYMPTPLRSRLTSLLPDNPETGHVRALKSAELVSRDIYWHMMESVIWKHVAGCESGHQIKAPHHACYGLNMPLPPPSRTWEGLTMDFVSNLP